MAANKHLYKVRDPLWYPKIVVSLLIVFSCSAYERLLLDIPARSQWNFSNGYCGSCSIQMAALYHGSYVSQDRVRKSIGDLEILFGTRMNRSLDSLGFQYTQWNGGEDITKYLVWLKETLHNRTPVIVATNHGDKYQHIIIMVGYTCDSVSAYNDNDTLFYNECHESYTSQQTCKIWQDPTMHNYFDPTRHYGTVVTGIKDPDKETVPVHVEIDRWNEPQPSSTPVTMNAKIHVRSLVKGKPYILLKYTDHTKVPVRNFADDGNYVFTKFVAAGDTALFNDSFLNTETAIFRCVPDNTTGMRFKPTDRTVLQHSVLTRCNPTSLLFTVPSITDINAGICNSRGQKVLSPVNILMDKENHTVRINIASLRNGVYYVYIKTYSRNDILQVVIDK